MTTDDLAAALLTPDVPQTWQEVREMVDSRAAVLCEDGTLSLGEEIRRLDMSREQLLSCLYFLSGAAPEQTSRAVARIGLFGAILTPGDVR
jgi:hypothetical protein